MAEIRKMTLADIPAAAGLEKLCFPDPWSAKGLRDTLREDRACFLAAEKEGTLCGYLNATWVLDECSLNRICVQPSCRRSGIASALLAELKAFCRQNGIGSIYLEVRESNAAARALYRAEGFAELGRRPRFYTSPEEDAVLMGWTSE